MIKKLKTKWHKYWPQKRRYIQLSFRRNKSGIRRAIVGLATLGCVSIAAFLIALPLGFLVAGLACYFLDNHVRTGA